MYEDTMIKIWGTRKRLLLTDTTEVDLLDLKKGSFCSIHSHNFKYNYFYDISAIVQIKTELGDIILRPGEDVTVNPHIIHQFKIIKSGKVLEIAYVNKGIINMEDIIRTKQGGRVINGEEMTLDEMREKGYLEL